MKTKKLSQQNTIEDLAGAGIYSFRSIIEGDSNTKDEGHSIDILFHLPVGD